MEKIEISDSAWYVFEDRFAVNFYESDFCGYTTIKYVQPDFRSAPEFRKLSSQTINLDLLSPVFLKSFIFGVSYPFKVNYTSAHLGKITTNSGYSAQDLGLGVRPIEKISCEITHTEQNLEILITVSASPVYPGSLHGTYSLEEKNPFYDEFILKIPVEEVPLVFQMCEVRKKYFLESHLGKVS